MVGRDLEYWQPKITEPAQLKGRDALVWISLSMNPVSFHFLVVIFQDHDCVLSIHAASASTDSEAYTSGT